LLNKLCVLANEEESMYTTPFIGGTIPTLRYIGSLQKKSGELFDRPLHHHPDHLELMLIAEGTVSLYIDGLWYEAPPQSLVIYNPGIWHEERIDTHSYHHIHYMGLNGFQFPGLPAGWLTDLQPQYITPAKEHYASLQHRFLEIAEQKCRNTSHSQWIANCLTAAFLVELLAMLTPQSSRNKRKANRDVTPVKQYIHEHYSESITLRELSKIAYLSPFHLSRLFKEQSGLSPMQYVISYRLEVAKYFLLRTNDSVAIIAERVGYASETHFQNLFKKWMGTTPAQFRKHGVD
jgi:AraC-like DNA-binding protein